jgi:hypothetical protein
MPDHSMSDDLHTPSDLGPAFNVAAAVIRLLTVLIGRRQRGDRQRGGAIDRSRR